uniref:Chromo domain-containing protein n=1 Tax=Peronospora matthiolae TaxID=2874970 RepID=A0AAV1V320_9STRA
MGNTYTIELLHKMRAHPTFYVASSPPVLSVRARFECEEHIRGREPRPPSSGPVSTSQSGRLAKRPVHAFQRCFDELQPAHHEENESNVRSQVARTQKRHDRPNDRALENYNYPSQDHQAHNAESVLEPGHLATVPLHGSALEHQADPTLEPDRLFPLPPHPLVNSGGGPRFLVEPILNHRDVNGVRTSYLVRWSGYPPAWDIWEPRAQLIDDVLGLVEQYDETHPLRLKKGRRKTTSPNASTGIARCQSLWPSWKRCAPSSRDH